MVTRNLYTKILPADKKISNRAEWIDMIRGVAMILVVYAHLCHSQTFLKSIISTTRMPLFFFISGFFMYSIEYNSQLIWRRTKNRVIKQLCPTIIFFLLFVAIFYHFDVIGGGYDEFKVGYWFTYVSVLYFFTLIPILYLFTKNRVKSHVRILAFTLLILISVVCQSYVASHTSFYSTGLSNLLSFEHYISYLRFIFLGCIFRILWNKYNTKLLKWPYFIISAISFVLSLYIGGYLILLTPVAGIYILLFTFYNLSRSFPNHVILRALAFIGSLTLEIYLIHYFVLAYFETPAILRFIKSTYNTIWEFPIVTLNSLIIILCCIIIVWVLRWSKIYSLLFWKK